MQYDFEMICINFRETKILNTKKSDYIYEVGPMIEVIKNYIGRGEDL